MKNPDEPLFDSEFEIEPKHVTDDPNLPKRIRRIVNDQLYGILCTQGHEQPYGSLIAFAFDESLNCFVFSTPIATRKYRLLSECNRVALVVDTRSSGTSEMSKIEGLTVTGTAHRIDEDNDFESCADMLVKRHPQLKSFIHAPSSALFRVDVFRYFHVARFQEVQEWIPPKKQ